jgi:membrane protease YdiL (CAAX protease family)
MRRAAPVGIVARGQGGLDDALTRADFGKDLPGGLGKCAPSVCTDGSIPKAVLHVLTWVAVIVCQFVLNGQVSEADANAQVKALGTVAMVGMWAGVVLVLLVGGLIKNPQRLPFVSAILFSALLIGIFANVAVLSECAEQAWEGAFNWALGMLVAMSLGLAQVIAYYLSLASMDDVL